MQDKKKPKPTKTEPAATRDRTDPNAKLTPKTRVVADGGGGADRHVLANGHDHGPITVRLARSAVVPTSDIALWAAIRKSTDAISFNNYDDFVTDVFKSFGRGTSSLSEEEAEAVERVASRRFLPFSNIEPYRLLKVATEVFLALYGAVNTKEDDAFFTQADADAATRTLDGEVVTIGDLEDLWDDYLVPPNGRRRLLPYLDIIRRRIDGCALQTILPTSEIDDSVEDGLALHTFGRGFTSKLFRPFMFELLWSYWQEEGMLVQTMNACPCTTSRSRPRGRTADGPARSYLRTRSGSTQRASSR